MKANKSGLSVLPAMPIRICFLTSSDPQTLLSYGKVSQKANKKPKYVLMKWTKAYFSTYQDEESNEINHYFIISKVFEKIEIYVWETKWVLPTLIQTFIKVCYLECLDYCWITALDTLKTFDRFTYITLPNKFLTASSCNLSE